MRGMRNRITREYFDINLGVVWETVQTALPALLNQLPSIPEAGARLRRAIIALASCARAVAWPASGKPGTAYGRLVSRLHLTLSGLPVAGGSCYISLAHAVAGTPSTVQSAGQS